MNSVDYSQQAISQRIRQVSQLRKLCLSLSKAKPADNASVQAIVKERKNS